LPVLTRTSDIANYIIRTFKSDAAQIPRPRMGTRFSGTVERTFPKSTAAADAAIASGIRSFSDEK
jgi:hypothetical protein